MPSPDSDMGQVRLMYMAHPLGAEEPRRTENIARAHRWLRWLIEVQPQWSITALWLNYAQVLDETWRARGLRDTKVALERCDGIVLVGGVMSPGMGMERDRMVRLGRPCFDLTALGPEPPAARRWPVAEDLL
jgi:hypothetical protein